MGRRSEKVTERWRILKNSSGFKNFMLFLVFVFVSAVFWFILALNDSAQDHFNVKLQVVNMPDSVTFISDVPDKFGVTVNDKGTNIWRNGYLKNPSITIDFKKYAYDGILHFTYSDLQSSLKETFGPSAQVTSLSLDSLHLIYTTNPGKIVPVVVDCQVHPASGTTLVGAIKASPSKVYVYGSSEVLDTIHYVNTVDLTLRDLSETTVMDVKIDKIKGGRAIPSKVSLTIPIEPLVRKEAMVTIDPINVPAGTQLLIFPSKVPVEYYVAMSQLSNDEDRNIELVVNYDDIANSTTGKLKVTNVSSPERLKNLTLKSDSVEYAVVRD